MIKTKTIIKHLDKEKIKKLEKIFNRHFEIKGRHPKIDGKKMTFLQCWGNCFLEDFEQIKWLS